MQGDKSRLNVAEDMVRFSLAVDGGDWPATMRSVLQQAATGPQLASFIITLSIACSIPVIIMLIAVHKSVVHVNCRFLISAWTVSLLGYLASVVIIHAMPLFPGAFPCIEATRTHLLFANVILHMCCTCFEMKIAIERIVSSSKPHIYHDSGFSYRWNIPCILLPFISGSLVGYTVFYSGTPIALIFPSVVDLSTVLLNWFGIRHLGRRFDSLFHSNATLNARYQVKESIRVAKVMQPVYSVSMLLKAAAFLICYSNELFEGGMDTELCGAYFIIHCFNCGFSSVFLIVHCDFIKNAIYSMLGMKRSGKSSRIIPAISHDETTAAYFAMLYSSWN